MNMSIVLDITNFILLFFLTDFINGFYGNFLAKKLKRTFLVFICLCLAAVLICCLTGLFITTKILMLIIELLAVIMIVTAKIMVNKRLRYKDVEAGKEQFFANQKVMILVPHEDDEINLAGGVIEEYLKHGSEVYVVFSTNGDGDERFDMSKMGYTRIHEAIKSLAVLGVPEQNIVFLGYGDGWDKSGPNIYNAKNDEVVKSRAGRTKTYGSKTHSAFHENNNYTYLNYFNDVKQVVLDYKPDTIFCIDYDTHNEHRALSMMFEKAVGDLLKGTSYRPMIYKGYGYRTAWNAQNDFSNTINIASTVNCCSDRDVILYNWNTRKRFPIDILSVSRTLKESKLYCALSAYLSQNAELSADRIINGDKVYWQRRTDSLLYDAEISVSSGDKNKLTDFMLLDCDDLINHGDMPYDGVWHPDEDDTEKEIRINLHSETYIDSIVLYDSPSPEDNIINAIIKFDDGSCILTGRLHSGGTSVSVKKDVRSFDIIIDQYEGDRYGLTEIEAFSKTDTIPPLYKITDDKDNFAYDYIIPQSGKQVFKIYQNTGKTVDYNDFSVSCDNKKCSAIIQNGEIVISCPKGRKSTVTLLLKNNKICDRILVRNPYKIGQFFLAYWQKASIHKSFAHRIYRLMKSKMKAKHRAK